MSEGKEETKQISRVQVRLDIVDKRDRLDREQNKLDREQNKLDTE
jgi:hypothetical protein